MKTQNMVEELKKCGIRAAAYKRPPIGSEVFAMTILPTHREGVITVNQGQARVQVYGNKKMRQAAVTIHEPPRIVTRGVKSALRVHSKPTSRQSLRELQAQFPVVMPPGSHWSVAKLEVSEKPLTQLDINTNADRKRAGLQLLDPVWIIAGIVTAIVGKNTTNHFLIGIDETRNFISPLPRKATSVMMAHRMLKPAKEMRRKAVRQGEWFFIPATRATISLLEKIATGTPDSIKSIRLGKTTHTAKSAIVIKGVKSRSKKSKGKRSEAIYARGYIVDSRKGHHRSLFLPKWSKVVRNKEAEIKVSPQQKKTVARRRKTWD